MKIQNLPRVAQQELMNAMDAADIIGLFLTSLQCRNLVTSFHWNNVQTVVDCTNFQAHARIQFGMNEEKLLFFRRIETEVEGGRTIPILWINENSFDLSHEDALIGMPDPATDAVRRQSFGKLCMSLLMAVFGEIGELTVKFGIQREFYFRGPRIVSASRRHQNILLDIDDLAEYFATFYEGLAAQFPVVGPNNLTMDSTLLNGPQIVIHDAHWMSGHALTYFRGTDAIFLSTEFENDDIINFVRNWRRSGNTTLRSMVLWQKQRGSIDRERISEMFRFTHWNPEQRPQHFFGNSDLLNQLPSPDLLRDCQNGMDIVRRSDGMLATVKIWENTVVCFYVWHHIRG